MKKEFYINKQNYKIETNIFNIYIAFLCLIFLISYFTYGFNKSDNLYMVCNPTVGITCQNPLYNSPDCGTKLEATSKYCTQEFLNKGETMGNPPPLILKLFPYIVAIGLILAFIINHFMYNKEFSFKGIKVEIDDTENKE